MGTGTTQKGLDGLPFGSVITDGINDPAALQGGIQKTDAQGHIIAPAAVSRGEGWKRTYSAYITGLVPGATPQDIFTITGVASTLVKVARLEIAGTATASATVLITLLKRSTANSGGTSTNPVKLSYDSGDTAAGATITAYTANPTAGTLVNNLRTRKLLLGATSPTTILDRMIEEYGVRPAKCPTLRSASEVYAVNLGGVTALAGWAFDIFIEWTEE